MFKRIFPFLTALRQNYPDIIENILIFPRHPDKIVPLLHFCNLSDKCRGLRRTASKLGKTDINI